MGTTGRSVELTGDAPLHPNSYPVYIDILVERRTKVIVFVFVWISWQ